jgi:hypothetical protein
MMDNDMEMPRDELNRPTQNLEGLPDELLLKILGYLRPNTRFYPTDIVYLLREVDAEGIRSLLDTCLTSKQLRRVAQPLLYKTVHFWGWGEYFDDEGQEEEEDEEASNSISPGIVHQLTCLLRTIRVRPDLARSVKIIRSPYRLGRKRQDSEWLKEEKAMEKATKEAIDADLTGMVRELSNPYTANLWTKMFHVTPGQAQMLLLLWLSPNVLELTLGTYDGSLCQLLGLELASNVPDFHGYKRLDTININTDEGTMPHPGGRKIASSSYPNPEPYDDLISSFECLPALRHYRHDYPTDVHGVLSRSSIRLDFRGYGLRNLRTLHLVDCLISMEQILDTVRSCHFLTEFRFRPANMVINPNDANEVTHLDFASLCEALGQSKYTLRYLYLSMGRNNSYVSYVDTYTTLAAGTLVGFSGLQTLVVPAAILTRGSEKVNPDDFHFDERNLQVISHIPTSIVSLGLSNEQLYRTREEDEYKSLAREAIAQLASGLGRLPKLQAIHMLHPHRSGIVFSQEFQHRCAKEGIEYVVKASLLDDEFLLRYYGVSEYSDA